MARTTAAPASAAALVPSRAPALMLTLTVNDLAVGMLLHLTLYRPRAASPEPSLAHRCLLHRHGDGWHLRRSGWRDCVHRVQGGR